MPIPLFGSIGALFNRIGKAGLVISQIRSGQNSQLTNLTDTTNGVVAQYDAESDLQALVGGGYLGVLTGMEGAGPLMANLAAQTVNRMVFRDSPLLNQSLQSINTLAALLEINRQMGLLPATVLAMTIAGTANPFSTYPTNAGNGVINFSTRRPQDGLVAENTFAEDIRFTCTADSYTGGATEGNEAFSVTGEGNQGDVWSFDWPLGSNASTSLNAIDGNVSTGSGNGLTNSGFNTFTVTNTPDNWTLNGAAGTVFFEESTLVYDGAKALRWLGDGTTGSYLEQRFGVSTGTTLDLVPLTQYSFNSFWRRDGTVPGAGVVTVALVDGNGNVFNDEGGNANSFTIDLTGLTTDYVSYTGVFRTPRDLPSTRKLRLTMSTGLTAGRSVYLDKASLGVMTRLYPSGPYAAMHAGSVPFQAGDYSILTMTNSRGSGGTLNTFQTLWQRLFFDLVMANELLLPSASSPNVLDSLIG